jgi:glycosyltransferase involved in cell wall biosynthesis
MESPMPEPGIRVLQAIAGGAHGGAEVFFVRLAQAFARAGVSQRALLRRGRPWNAQVREAGVDVVELPFGGALDLMTKRAFRREIESFRPTVVLTWMNRATRFCPPANARLGTAHIARLGGYYDLKYYASCDHLIGNTRGIVAYLRKRGWPAGRCDYVPNFVDGEAASPVPRASLDTPAEAPLLLALGRLHENKAFDVLLRALPALPDAYLWLAGEGPARDELRALAERLGVTPRVRFLGWRDDVSALLASADILVCPSRIEPFGNVVAEAWAQSVPVVASASDGPREIITSGETGLIVPLEDAPAIASAVRTVIDNPAMAARMVESGRAAFDAEFTEQVVVARYLELFEKAALSCVA